MNRSPRISPTEVKRQRRDAVRVQRRKDARLLKEERELFQFSGFIMTFAEAFDGFVPFGLAPAVGRAILRRRMHRHHQG